MWEVWKYGSMGSMGIETRTKWRSGSGGLKSEGTKEGRAGFVVKSRGRREEDASLERRAGLRALSAPRECFLTAAKLLSIGSLQLANCVPMANGEWLMAAGNMSTALPYHHFAAIDARCHWLLFSSASFLLAVCGRYRRRTGHSAWAAVTG